MLVQTIVTVERVPQLAILYLVFIEYIVMLYQQVANKPTKKAQKTCLMD
jgi:hypothetical protein